jgi:hypothetical protein
VTPKCKVRIKWLHGTWTENASFLCLAKNGWGSVESHVNHLTRLTSTSAWQLIVDGEIIAEKVEKPNAVKPKTEDLKVQAKRLYKEHENYAKVAKIMGKHPTTIRTWCNESV